MLADTHRYRISTKNFIKIGQAVSEEYGNENCDTKILYTYWIYFWNRTHSQSLSNSASRAAKLHKPTVMKIMQTFQLFY